MVHIVTLAGPHNPAVLDALRAAGEDFGYSVISTTVIEGDSGRPVTPADQPLRMVAKLGVVDPLTLEHLGLGKVYHVAALSLYDAWFLMREVPGYVLGSVASYMVANNLTFAGGEDPKPYADGWRAYEWKVNVLPELTELDGQTRGAVLSNHIYCLGLLRQIPDAVLTKLRLMSEERTRAVRAAIRAYDESR